MAVKHLNFAGKSAVGQKQRSSATRSNRELKPLNTITKKVARNAVSPVQKATLKNAVAGIAKGSAVAAGNAARKTALAAGMKGALTASAKASASGGGHVSRSMKPAPVSYGKGLGITQTATKKPARKVKGH